MSYRSDDTRVPPPVAGGYGSVGFSGGGGYGALPNDGGSARRANAPLAPSPHSQAQQPGQPGQSGAAGLSGSGASSGSGGSAVPPPPAAPGSTLDPCPCGPLARADPFVVAIIALVGSLLLDFAGVITTFATMMNRNARACSSVVNVTMINLGLNVYSVLIDRLFYTTRLSLIYDLPNDVCTTIKGWAIVVKGATYKSYFPTKQFATRDQLIAKLAVSERPGEKASAAFEDPQERVKRNRIAALNDVFKPDHYERIAAERNATEFARIPKPTTSNPYKLLCWHMNSMQAFIGTCWIHLVLTCVLAYAMTKPTPDCDANGNHTNGSGGNSGGGGSEQPYSDWLIVYAWYDTHSRFARLLPPCSVSVL